MTTATANVLPRAIPVSMSESTLNKDQLRLLHHYLTYTSLTLQALGDNHRVWQTEIPHQALSNDFLMHALFAVTELHLLRLQGQYHLSPSSSLSRVWKHRSEATTIFFSTVREITPLNCTPIVAFAILFLVLSCGVADLPNTGGHTDPLDGLVCMFSTLRASVTLFNSVQSWIAKGPFSQRPSVTNNKIAIGALGDEHLHRLEALNSESKDPVEEQLIYTMIIKQLRQRIQKRPPPGTWSSYDPWCAQVPDEYVSLLKNRRPMALLILAHWCARESCYVQPVWFIQDLHIAVVEGIARSIACSWTSALDWPIETLGITYV